MLSNSVIISSSIALVAASVAYCFLTISTIALARARGTRLRELKEEKFFMAELAENLLADSESSLLSCQVGIALALLGGGVCLIQGMLVDPLVGLGLWLLVSLLVSLGAEIFRSAVQMQPEKSLCYLALPLSLFGKLFYPLILLLRVSRNSLQHLFGLPHAESVEVEESELEFEELTELKEQVAEMEGDKREILKRMFSFSDRVVREVMVQRKDIITVPDISTLEEVIEIFNKEGFSRLVVVGSDLDDIKGVVLAKDLLPFLGKAAHDFRISSILRPAHFVPNTKKVDDLFDEFKRAGIHLAVVLDEHGGVDGLVTLEDLIEEIVGQIADEYDQFGHTPEVQEMRSGDLLVEGSMLLSDFNSQFGFEFPEGEYDTIAGFVIHLFGRIPEERDEIEYLGTKFIVEQVVQNRVSALRVVPIPESGFDQKAKELSKITPIDERNGKKSTEASANLLKSVDSEPGPLRIQGLR